MDTSDRKLLYSLGLPERELNLTDRLLDLERITGGKNKHRRVMGVTLEASCTNGGPMIFIDVALKTGFINFDAFKSWLKTCGLPAKNNPAADSIGSCQFLYPDFVRITDEPAGRESAYVLRTGYVVARFSVRSPQAQNQPDSLYWFAEPTRSGQHTPAKS